MKFVLASAGCFAIGSVLSVSAFNQCRQDLSLWMIACVVVIGFTAIASLLTGASFLFLITQPVSRFTSLGRSLFHVLVVISGWNNKWKLVDFEASCQKPREAQEESLRYILQRVKGTALYQDKGLAKVHSLDELREKVSLSTYKDYQSYVDRTARGEENVMVKGLPDRLILTSGTTGKGKLFPIKSHMELMMIADNVLHASIRRYFPGINLIRPMLFFYCLPTLKKSESGIDIASIGYIGESLRKMMLTTSTPKVGYNINTTHEALYIHLLFGIRDKDVGTFSAVFTTMILEAMQLLERKWPELVRDIEIGSIDHDLNLTPDLRNSLTEALGGGDKHRAHELRREFEMGFVGIMKRMWPNVHCIPSVDILNIKEQLMKTYCRGIIIYSHSHSGSEGMYGFNMNPFSVTPEYTAALFSNNVLEFIPEEEMDESDPKTFFVDEVEAGKKYEMVITQINGLCRYRVGDVVEITGHHYKCPKMKFLYRSGTLLNMCGEKLSSDIVKGAVNDAFKSKYPDVDIIYHTVAESGLIFGEDIAGLSESKTKGAHYIFFIELEDTDDVTKINTAAVAESVDENLYERHRFYRNFRDTKQIHPSSVYLVHPGSFYKLRDYVIANSSSSSIQFKIPDKLRTVEMFKTLFNCRI